MKNGNQNKRVMFYALMLLCSCALMILCGCFVVEYFKPEGPPYDEQLYESYNRIELDMSGSADVLVVISRPEYELLSQSKSVVASFGQKKEGCKRWFSMVAFDEDDLTARRKYLFMIDEKAKGFLAAPKRDLVFFGEVIMSGEVMDEPYADENARRIAILRQFKEDFLKDVGEVSGDNRQIEVCGMLGNQVMGSLLYQVEQSPVLASDLDKPEGMKFDHITLGECRVQMVEISGLVRVNIFGGSHVMELGRPFAIEE